MAEFVNWYYHGLSGFGGWAVFLLLAAAALIGLLVDSARRHLPAGSWRLGTFLTALLLLAPSTVIKLSPGGLPLYGDVLAVIGLLGGLIPVWIAIVYALRFRGLVGCVKGHKPYRADLRECPQCARQTVQGLPGIKIEKRASEPTSQSGTRKTSRGAARTDKPRADAWLVDEEDSVYQINLGQTTIGRAPQNDIRLWEASASRTHAKIVEDKGTFTIYDMGSVAGTWIAGQRVRKPQPLTSGDVVTFGTSTRMTFTTRPGDLK